MAKKFKFSAGDRVDFDRSGVANGTPGTIVNRVHTQPMPLYAIKWDDGNDDNATYREFELISYVDRVENDKEEASVPTLSTEKRPGSTYVVCNLRTDRDLDARGDRQHRPGYRLHTH